MVSVKDAESTSKSYVRRVKRGSDDLHFVFAEKKGNVLKGAMKRERHLTDRVMNEGTWEN